MIWQVFRKEASDEPHVYCGNVHAPDEETALQFAQIQHARRKPTHSLWVVPKEAIAEVTETDAPFGGELDKSYRWVSSFTHVTPPEDNGDAADAREASRGEGD